MEINAPQKNFWKNKKVFITGHTGFKGSWLCILLNHLDAHVNGYALLPNTEPALYNLSNCGDFVNSTIADIRNLESLKKAMISAQPEIVIHMAAQPLVRASYTNPVETYAINVMGSVNLFEAVRHTNSVKAVLNITTDKCYDNKEWPWGYRENDSLGGYDPYSSSKACSELVTIAYRNSFFNIQEYERHGIAVATARAGNVIGGGDWASDRLIPDLIRAMLSKQKMIIRNPSAIRPWQHVLEPLCGYLLLLESLYKNGVNYAEAWNFGPNDVDAKPVKWIVQKIAKKWKEDLLNFEIDSSLQPHESTYLKLDCSKAKTFLNWQPKWSLETAIDKIIEFTEAYVNKENIREVCTKQIINYLNKC